MNILIATIGTRGDVQPYLALAIGLQAAGHKVTICTCPQFREFITEYGIAFASLDDGLLKLLESDQGRAIVDDLNGLFGVLRTLAKVLKQVGPIHRRMVSDCWAAVEANKPEIIIYHPKMFFVPAFAAVRKIPAVLAMLCPLHVPTANSPLFGRSMGRFYNRATYRLVHCLTKFGANRYLREWRAEFDIDGLSKSSSPNQISTGNRIPVIHAISEFVCPKPHDWPDYASSCGYWFLPIKTINGSTWEPLVELTQFLKSGPAPVYIGFGSMVGTNPAQLTQLILAAVEKAGVRAVLSIAWGGIVSVEHSPHIHVVQSAPHEWLFPQMAAVVHHGGAGTTAAGLRAACPTIICPYGLDQPFWGRRVVELGAGLAIPQKQLSEALLAEAITTITSDESYRISAQKLAKSITSENGIASAIQTIESIAFDHPTAQN